MQCATFFTERPGRPYLFTDQLPCKFRLISFRIFRGKVENVSANHRTGGHLDRPEKRKLGRGRWDLASCQVSLNSVKRFQRRNRKSLNQSDTRAAILFFQSARKTQTWYKTLRSCFLSSFGVNFVQRCPRGSRKCDKLTTDEGRTTDNV